MKKILKDLKECKTFYNFLVYVRDTEDLKLCSDNNWTWLEYKGVEVPGSGRERFINSSELTDLFTLAKLN